MAPTIALISVLNEGDYQFPQEIPLGIAHIASWLRAQGFDVALHQCFPDQGGDDEIERAAAIDADIYGFQLNIVNFLGVRAVAARIKARRPETLVVLGGPFLSSLAEQILEGEAAFDCMVFGEGELTMQEIVERHAAGDIDLSAIRGLVWRDAAGKAVRNAPRPLIDDLDKLPFPARDFLGQARRDPVDGGLLESVRVISSRGCVANCSFCSVNFYTKLQKGKLWRGRSATHVVDELEQLHRTTGARLFNFADSSFEDPGRIGKQRTRDICRQIIERRLPLSFKVYMRCDTMLDDGDAELLALWKQAGIDVICIGVEAGSDYELDYYHKRANLDMNRRTVARLKAMDAFYVHIGFLMFGPNSTMDTLRQNIAFLRECGFADNVNPLCNVLMLVRDSKVYSVLKQEGRVIEAENFWELPKYEFQCPRVRRGAAHWDGLFGRYPVTRKVSAAQVEIENIIARMSNPMNAAIRDAVGPAFAPIKAAYLALKEELGAVQADYFSTVLDMLEEDASDAALAASAETFFGPLYARYAERYAAIQSDLLRRIADTGLGTSGITFRHFYSAMADKGVTRV